MKNLAIGLLVASYLPTSLFLTCSRHFLKTRLNSRNFLSSFSHSNNVLRSFDKQDDDDDDDDDEDEELGTAALIGPGKLKFVDVRSGCSLHYGSAFCVVCF